MADDPPKNFFKFIKPGSKFNLLIPKSFWTTLKVEPCNKAILKRGRHKWPVDISDQGAFGDGWRKCVTDNEVQEFDFIVFEHQGKMMFEFMVFDQSLCEREYPNLLDEMNVKEPLRESDSTHIHERSKKVKKRKRNDYSSIKKDNFQLGGDKNFVIVMTPDYIKSSRLHVPVKFAISNGLLTKKTRNEIVHTQIVLIDEAQRTWPATVQTSSRRVLLAGWNELKIKNHLKSGDLCMFELVKHGEVPVFSFYKLGKKPITDHIQAKQTSSSLNQETNSTHNNHCYFISTLKPCTFKNSCLCLPVEFSMPNGLKIGEMILRDDKGRSWKVQLNKNTEKSFYLGCGIKDFCYANGLKEGDAYRFELVENEKDKPPVVNFSYMAMDVKEPPRESDSIHKVSSFEDLDVEEPVTEFDTIYTHERSKKLKNRKTHNYSSQNKDKYQLSKDRSFMAVMTPYYIRASKLNVPMKFGRSSGFITKRLQTEIVYKQIVITDEAQRTWPAMLEIKGTKIHLMKWHELKIENNLEVGDMCMFELVKHGEVPVFNFCNLGKKPLTNSVQVKQETGPINNKATSSTHNNHRYFVSTLSHNSITKSGLYLPIKFSISNGLKLGEMILSYDRGRSWKVGLAKNGENNFFLGCGFLEFCNANGLEEGYKYKFEIIENKKDKPPVMNVSWYEDLTPGKKNYQYFIGEVKSYFIEKMLHLPVKFARNNELFNKEEMILKNVKSEGSWTVKLKSSMNRYCYLGQGWKEFHVANGLKEGDLFKLELVENGEKPIANFYFQNID